MNTKRNILIVLLSSILNLAFCQSEPISLKIENKTYPALTLTNVFRWLEMSTSDWETEMRKYDFTDRKPSDGCIFHGTGASLNNAILAITKCPGNKVELNWRDYSSKKTTKLDHIVDELEPYFIAQNGATAEYGFIKDDKRYRFIVLRDDGLELFTAIIYKN